MNSRLYFLSSFVLLSACVQSQQPVSDAFFQSELMPPKSEEIAIVEEKKDNQESILSEILAAIKAPLVSKEEPQAQPTPTPVTQMQPAPVQPQTHAAPPITIPQTTGSSVMPQILQATPGGGSSSPFFQTIVFPQTMPFAYPAPMPTPAQPVQAQAPQNTAPFYSTPATQTNNLTPQAPAQNLPVQPVGQPQQTATQPVNNIQNNPYMMQNSQLPVSGYNNYQQENFVVSNPYASSSAEVILPDTYQLPTMPQQIPVGHVMSGQEAYPVWNSEETYYEEIKPSPLNNADSQSENINIPRW